MLHISIRLEEKSMVRNTLQNKKWQAEERHGVFNFNCNEPFEITILVEFKEYKIAVNRIHNCEFAHRLPLHLVQYMNVKCHGEVVIENIFLEQQQQIMATSILPVNQYPAIGVVATTTHAYNPYANRINAHIPTAPPIYPTCQPNQHPYNFQHQPNQQPYNYQPQLQSIHQPYNYQQ
ncbi:hypothetical protein PVAND_011078 [Polypedilum vanderplanki]|uniref:Galectin n=1 Tax=Polypedilum vanderplanki TaxID=319348 RepID=A0A9J6CIF7_POLVA|nr:hypothetical protein PVAND_011078 [Polypedilum vanderplanki]